MREFDARLLLQSLGRLARQGAADDTVSVGFPHLARSPHHRGLAGARAADNRRDPLSGCDMRDGGALLCREVGVTRGHGGDDRRLDRKSRAAGEMDGTPRHLRFEPDQLARRVFRRRPRARRKVDRLAFQPQRIGALQHPRHQALEGSGIVDIAMQELGDIPLIEHALFPRNHVEHDLRTALDPPQRLGPVLVKDAQPFEVRIATLTLRPALDGLGRDPDMGGRHDVDAALCVGPPINANFVAVQGKMLVLQVEPAVALLEELLLVAGPKPVGDLAGFHA